ncbi:MAG: EndoU domain-containing protein [Thermoleophilia bacterium]|nr:EndoU domain-containing protein [Thermoleophilia bacterium]
MGLFDVVTKPIAAAANAVGDAIDKGKDVVEDVVDKGAEVVGDVAEKAADTAKHVAEADGWAGLAARLNPITGPVLQGVDTIKAVKNLADGKEGASVWDIPALGFAKGFGEGAVDLVKGVGYLGLTSIKSNPLRALVDRDGFVEQWKQNLDTAGYVATHLPEVGKAIVEPITSDVDAGRYYEVEGRGAFEVLNVIFGAKGANKIAESIGLAGKGAEAAGTAGRIAEGAGEVADDAGRAGSAVDDAARAAEEAGTAADDAGRAAAEGAEAARAANGKLLDELAPGLNAEERAFAEQLDVAHIFKGDAEGGLHWTPGEGTFDGAEVRALKPIKPNSTWRAEVTIDGAVKESTMFPTEWSPEEVIRAIKEAAENAPESATKAGNVPGTEVLTGESRGIRIRIVRSTETGEIITANPSQAGKAFTP